MELKSASLEKEIALLKAKEQKSCQHLGKGEPAMGKNQAQSITQRKSLEISAKLIGSEEERLSQGQRSNITPSAQPSAKKPSAKLTSRTKKPSYAAVAASTPAQIFKQPWTQVKYKNRKANQQHSTNLALNAEYQGRRIFFLREETSRQMSEVDLILVLIEALARVEKGVSIRFLQLKYSQLGALSALFTEKANAGLIIPRLSKVLI